MTPPDLRTSSRARSLIRMLVDGHAERQQDAGDAGQGESCAEQR
jgi:hypothetical protein